MAEGRKQMTVYLDSNVFIYSILEDTTLGEQALNILQMVQDGKLEAHTSILTFDEIVYVVKKTKNIEQAILAGNAFLDFNNLKIADAKKETARNALKAIEEYSLLPRDALHYSTMKLLGISEIITEDKDFRKIKEIKCHSIKEFLSKQQKIV